MILQIIFCFKEKYKCNKQINEIKLVSVISKTTKYYRTIISKTI